MSRYYGIFKDIAQMYEGNLTECGVYDDIFSTVYTKLNGDTHELSYYLENARVAGKRVLEVACGDGGNYMIPMARKGFDVDGVEISTSMIDRFREKAQKLPEKVRKHLKIYHADIFDFEPEHLYDLIIIPSTTICLLADDDERLRLLFDKMYSFMEPGGRFMFDYRTDQLLGDEYESDVMTMCNPENEFLMLLQEFNNREPGISMVNMYVETPKEKYLASSSKRIITDQLIENMINEGRFVRHNSYNVTIPNATIKLQVLKKEAV